MEQIQPYLDYFAAHPNWAIAVVFLIAFGEALLVIGLFVPSTAVLVGAGTLVGAGKLPFWPIMIATILGCVAGDQVSYWAGRIFGDRLKSMWPLKNYPHLLAKGEAYVREHGGKSIALGRFVPGVKAVVPGIAGMFGMGQAFFLAVNVTSGIAWGAMHLLPGILLGQALSLAGELSGRLAVVLIVLLVVLAIVGWLVRVVAASLSPYRKAAQGRFSAWARSSSSPTLRRLGAVIGPDNPNSVLLLLLVAVGIAALLGLADLVSGLIVRQAVSNFDHSLYNFFSELRSVPGDELFVRITMLGDEPVLLAMAAVPVLWFAARRNWRSVLATVLAVAAAKIVLLVPSIGVSAPVPGVPRFAFKFPSAHALEAGTVFAILAVLTARGFSRWTQALIASGSALIVIAIAFSRLYLGVSWLTDVLGGVLIAGILGVFYSVATATINLGRFHPAALLATSLTAWLIAGGINIAWKFDRQLERYQPLDKMTTMDLSDYLAKGWNKLPGQRIDIIGKPEEIFVVQWIGSLQSLKDILQKNRYKLWDKWGWRDALPYLNTDAALAGLAPRPAVHEGLKAKVTATLDDTAHAPQRIVLRAYQSNTKVLAGQSTERVYLINIDHEQLKSGIAMFSVPSDSAVPAQELSEVVKALTADPQVETLAQIQSGAMPVIILRPKH